MTITENVAPPVPTNRHEADALWLAVLTYARKFLNRNDQAMFASDYASFGVRKGLSMVEFEKQYYPNTALRTV